MSIESEIKRAITLGYDIEIRYEKYGGEVSQRKVSNIHTTMSLAILDTAMPILKDFAISGTKKELFGLVE